MLGGGGQGSIFHEALRSKIQRGLKFESDIFPTPFHISYFWVQPPWDMLLVKFYFTIYANKKTFLIVTHQ